MPRLRWIGLKAAVLFTKLTSGLRLTDTHNGLRAMTADAARKLKIMQNRMAHASEIINGIARFRNRPLQTEIPRGSGDDPLFGIQSEQGPKADRFSKYTR